MPAFWSRPAMTTEPASGSADVSPLGAPEPLSRATWLGSALLLALAVIVVYGKSLGYEFVEWDDDLHVTSNPLLATWSGLGQLWRESYVRMYIPVSYTYYALLAWLSRLVFGDAELSPALFHAGNLTLHILNTLLVWTIVRRLVPSATAALLGALVFAIHPLQAEVVVWIGEARALLATSFGLSAILVYWRATASRAQVAAGGAGVLRHRVWLLWYLLATLLFGLALLSKPSAVSIPLIVVAIEWLLRSRSLWQTLAWQLPWGLMALVVVWQAKTLQPNNAIGSVPRLWQRLLVAADALAFYLGKLLMPVQLAFDYGRTPEVALEGPYVYWMLLVPLGLVVLVLLSPRRRIWLGVLVVTVAGLVSVLGLVPFIYQAISTVADRYMYLPMLGVALGVGYWLSWHRGPAMIGLWGATLGIWAMIAWQQADTWRDSRTLFGHGLELNQRSYMAHYTLGLMAQRAGELDEAEAHYRAAIEIAPHHGYTLNGLGTVLAAKGQYDEAVAIYRRAINSLATDPDMLVNMAIALRKAGHWSECQQKLSLALRHGPRFVRAHVELGNFLADEGRYDQAIYRYRRALEIDPRDVQANFRLGEALARSGKTTEAADAFRTALAAAPQLADAYNNLGALMFLEGRYAEAHDYCRQALALRPQLVQARFNLGAALIELGHREAGISELRRLERQTSDPALLEAARQLIESARAPE